MLWSRHSVAADSATVPPPGCCPSPAPQLDHYLNPMKLHAPLVLIVALLLGCATNNVDPAQARANTGYVDFYSTNGADLHWEVIETASRKKLFSEYEPVE